MKYVILAGSIATLIGTLLVLILIGISWWEKWRFERTVKRWENRIKRRRW